MRRTVKSIYLVNPASDGPSYYSVDVLQRFGMRPAALVADLAIATLGGMLAPHMRVALCDEAITPVDLDVVADAVGITGKVTQSRRMLALAQAYRARGKVVIIGGPYAALAPERWRAQCDILVEGEVEDIIDDIAADLVAGTWQECYKGGRPDLSRPTPLPAWDLYPNDRATVGTVQTGRGCPFECEFCDVIQYLGRKQRFKPIPTVLAELDQLYRLGYRKVFLCDDNFTVNRGRARELLDALVWWNSRQQDGTVSFNTQGSIDAARDPELLALMARAGLNRLFIGLETPNAESLQEAHKRQNLKIDLTRQVEIFVQQGISVSGGMIVGFDADGLDIFDRQYDFAMTTPVPIFSVGTLAAPEATPLHTRLAQAGRLMPDSGEEAFSPVWTNIIPLRMSRAELFAGMRVLVRRLYDPAAFGRRLEAFVDMVGQPPETGPKRSLSGFTSAELDMLTLVKKFRFLGPEEESVWRHVQQRLGQKPYAASAVLADLAQYMQTRWLYEHNNFWDSSAARL